MNAKVQGFNSNSYATGNLASDPYKGTSTGMTVTYNHLHLPTAMSFGSNGLKYHLKESM